MSALKRVGYISVHGCGVFRLFLSGPCKAFYKIVWKAPHFFVYTNTRPGAAGKLFTMKKFFCVVFAACILAACNKIEPKGEGGYAKLRTEDKAPAWVEAVDLGLSVKWASCNIGASSPAGYGDYFAWGETEPKDDYSLSKWTFMDSPNQLTKYCCDPRYGYNGFTDNKTILDSDDDAATVNWGGNWRTPTLDEWLELHNNCTWKYTAMVDIDGFNTVGYKVTSKKSGYAEKWIFLPAASFWRYTSLSSLNSNKGFYWSSNCTGVSADAYYLSFDSGKVRWYTGGWYCGVPVRPVSEY